MPTPVPTLDEAAVVAHCRDHDFAAGQDQPTVGIELEWLTVDRDGRRLDLEQAHEIVDEVAPRCDGRITIEPGGQLELSTATHDDVDEACAAAATDLYRLDSACAAHDVELVALGADPERVPERIVTAPRYQAMESYFDALGVAGRTMMCNTAALQVNVCLGAGDRQVERWRLAHELGPTLTATFANSPFAGGGPTGWQSSRLRTWWMLDPSRSAPVPTDVDPAVAWSTYALDARVMLIRSADGRYHPVDAPLTFRGWLSDGHELGYPDIDDLAYHLTTLFPPVRPKGWLELRMFDALPTPFWHVATAMTVALLDEPAVTDDVRRIVEPTTELWVDAAQLGLGHPVLSDAAVRLADLALEVIEQGRGAGSTLDAVAAYRDRWVARGRCPADDRLDAWRAGGPLWPPRGSPVRYDQQLSGRGLP